MLGARIIPCLLMKNGGLVKSIRFKDYRYIGDPINTVKIFNDKEVDELIFLDIDASKKEASPNLKIVSEIASECFMPVCYGGGVTSIEQIREIFQRGIEKVSLNTIAVQNPGLIRKASEMFGSQSIVVSIDYKKNFFGRYELYIKGGTKNTKLNPIAFAKEAERMGAGEILLNSINRDGTMKGYDIQIIKEVCQAVNIPVIACGGAGRLEDLAEVICQGGASAAAAGSLFVYEGPHRAVLINYPSKEIMDSMLDD